MANKKERLRQQLRTPSVRPRRESAGIVPVHSELQVPESAKECPDCAELVRVRAKLCRHCGYEFVHKRGLGPRRKPARTVIHVHQTAEPAQPQKSPGIAAVLSFFYYGLGQIYCGRVIRGLLFILTSVFVVWGVLAAVFIFADEVVKKNGIDYTVFRSGHWVMEIPSDLVGVLWLAIILGAWLFNIYDAHRLAEKYNIKRARKRR